MGAANSAGQAALNLTKYANRVILLVRAASLEASMSQYLVSRIRAAPNIDVLLQTQVVGARGNTHLEALTLADLAAQAPRRRWWRAGYSCSSARLPARIGSGRR